MSDFGQVFGFPLGAAPATFTPANPTGNSTITNNMEGVGSTCVITPTRTGRVYAAFDGVVTNGTNGGGGSVQLRFGTGTAPANSTAAAGTLVGNSPSFTVAAASQTMLFAKTGLITGLTIGTQVWIDLALTSSSAGALANIANLSVTLFEID